MEEHCQTRRSFRREAISETNKSKQTKITGTSLPRVEPLKFQTDLSLIDVNRFES